MLLSSFYLHGEWTFLLYSDASISVNGVQSITDSSKTKTSGDGVRATWTWSDGEGWRATISVLPKLDS